MVRYSLLTGAEMSSLKELISVSSEPSALAQRLAAIATFGLTPDYYNDLTKAVAMPGSHARPAGGIT